jgi:hypothetical protein
VKNWKLSWKAPDADAKSQCPSFQTATARRCWTHRRAVPLDPQHTSIVVAYPFCDNVLPRNNSGVHTVHVRFSGKLRGEARERRLVSEGVAMTYQLPLFSVEDPGPLKETPDPITLLRKGAALVLSVSGGKDSEAECAEFTIIERLQVLQIVERNLMNEIVPINHKTVVFTKHARERLELRRIGEDMAIQIMRNPSTTLTIDDGKIKFIGKSMGAKVQVVGKPIPEQNKWLVVSLWVRGEDDAGNFVNHRKHRRNNLDAISKFYTSMFFLVILLIVIFYLSQSG